MPAVEGADARAANLLLKRARDSELVIPQLVESYGGAIDANLDLAFDRAEEGLNHDEGNGYLNRRAAFYLVRMGEFRRAERFARRAVEIADDEVTDRCLLGDVLLGQGRLTQALDQYRLAEAQNPEHPLPVYHRGYALILVGALLEREIDVRQRAQTASPDDDALQRIRRRRQLLGEVASRCFTAAQPRFRHAEYASSREVSYRDHQVSTRIGLYRSAWMSAGQPSVRDAMAALRAFHHSDALHRDLILANMWQQQTGSRLWRDLLNDTTWSQVRRLLGLGPESAGGAATR
jgi:tetratricopeptide (TPR) repeat protein